MAVVGLGALHFDIYALDSEKYETDVVSEASLGEENSPVVIKKIKAELCNLQIDFVRGEAFSFEYFTSESLTVEYGFDSQTGVFTVKTAEKARLKIFDFFDGIKRNRLKYKFTVPADVSVELDCRNSSVDLENVKLRDFAARVTNAELELDGVECDGFVCDGANSSVRIEDSFLTRADAKGSNAAFKCEESDFGSFSFDGSNAALDFENVKIDSLDFTGSNGSVKITGAECDKMSFIGNNARVDVSLNGGKEDFASVKMKGNNASFKFCGEKFDGNYSGEGTKTFVAQGNNMTVRLSFE